MSKEFFYELEEEAKMHLVERMLESPPNCMVCGRGNTPDETGAIGPFLDLERNVNWDDSTYLCRTCGEAIGTQFGMPTPDVLVEKDREIRRLKHQVHELKARRRTRVVS